MLTSSNHFFHFLQILVLIIFFYISHSYFQASYNAALEEYGVLNPPVHNNSEHHPTLHNTQISESIKLPLVSTVDQKSSVANIAFNSMRQPTQGAGQGLGLGLGVLSNTDNIINSSRRATIGTATTSSASDQATARMASTNIPMSRPTGALSSSLVFSSSITSLFPNSSSVRVTIISLSSDCHVFDALSYSTFLCSAVLSRPVLNWI